jgi:hypothetical protein
MDGGSGMVFGCAVYVLTPLLILGLLIGALGTWRRWNDQE